MSIPIQCKDCKLEGAQLEMCNIRKYRFEALIKKCPREAGFESATQTVTTAVPIAPVKVAEEVQTVQREVSLEPLIEIYNADTLEKLTLSKQQQGYLETVKKDQFGNILSGRHRKRVDPKWAEETVPIKDELDREVKIVHFNVHRRVPIEETQLRVLRIAQILESQGVPIARICGQISKLLPYDEGHIMRLLPDKYKQKQMAREVFQPILYNVWSFGKCDSRFGKPNFPGRIPGQIVMNLLYYYTNEGELVVDPMAGSGTTYDVCQYMNRKCLSYDITPIRDFIKSNDIRNGFPEETKGCDLIFLDPPYWKMKKQDFGIDSVSNEPLTEFLQFLGKLAKASYGILKPHGTVAILMADMTEKATYSLSGETYLLFKNAGFSCIAHVSCPLSTQEFLPQQVERAKIDKHLLGRNRDLYVFQKQT